MSCNTPRRDINPTHHYTQPNGSFLPPHNNFHSKRYQTLQLLFGSDDPAFFDIEGTVLWNRITTRVASWSSLVLCERVKIRVTFDTTLEECSFSRRTSFCHLFDAPLLLPLLPSSAELLVWWYHYQSLTSFSTILLVLLLLFATCGVLLPQQRHEDLSCRMPVCYGQRQRHWLGVIILLQRDNPTMTRRRRQQQQQQQQVLNKFMPKVVFLARLLVSVQAKWPKPFYIPSFIKASNRPTNSWSLTLNPKPCNEWTKPMAYKRQIPFPNVLPTPI